MGMKGTGKNPVCTCVVSVVDWRSWRKQVCVEECPPKSRCCDNEYISVDGGADNMYVVGNVGEKNSWYVYKYITAME
jgi:hypothetical protein